MSGYPAMTPDAVAIQDCYYKFNEAKGKCGRNAAFVKLKGPDVVWAWFKFVIIGSDLYFICSIYVLLFISWYTLERF